MIADSNHFSTFPFIFFFHRQINPDLRRTLSKLTSTMFVQLKQIDPSLGNGGSVAPINTNTNTNTKNHPPKSSRNACAATGTDPCAAPNSDAAGPTPRPVNSISCCSGDGGCKCAALSEDEYAYASALFRPTFSPGSAFNFFPVSIVIVPSLMAP